MDGALLSRFPHLSWLPMTFSLRANTGATGIHMESVAHSLSMTLSGQHSVRWIHRGHEQAWKESPGSVHFRPCNGEWQDFVIHSAESGDVLAFLIPPHHLEEMASLEGVRRNQEYRRFLVDNDTILQRSMLTLSKYWAFPEEVVGGADEAARTLLLRITELTGGSKPDWHDDESVFEPRVLRYLVEFIDEHIRIAPTLSDMALLVGLSPSHFAKKFRQSTGLSLHRFVNRRRVVRSLETLKDQSQPLSHIAFDLGFSSQSHFTHIFSGLTGMTPAKYQKRFRRTVGCCGLSTTPSPPPAPPIYCHKAPEPAHQQVPCPPTSNPRHLVRRGSPE